MTFNSTLLKSAVLTVVCLISGSLVAATPLHQPAQDRQSIIEKREWLYVDNCFQTKLDEVATFMNRRGQNIQSIAPYLGGIISVLPGVAVMEIVQRTLQKKKDFGNSVARMAAGFVAGLAGAKLSSVLISKIIKVLGSWLAKEENRCALVLTDFVKNWETHKGKTPVVLHGLFNGLYARHKTNEALDIVVPADAAMIVNMVRDTVQSMRVLQA